MASTYSTNLALELIGTGDQAGTWGLTTNTNLGTLIEQAISGYVTQAVATGTDTTITIPNGATGVARNMYIELTGTGGTNTNLIVPANKKLYFIFNNTSSGQVTVKVSGQTGVSVPNKAKMILVSNGTDIVDATNYIGNISAASANITTLTSASATITNLIATSGSISTLVSSDLSATVARSASATITNLLATSTTVSSGSTLNGGVVINEPGADVDFRVESDTDTHCLFVDASANAVGIGTASPAFKLDVLDGTANGNVGTPIARIVGANQAISGETGTLSLQSNSNMAADTGGSIILGGRGTTASTNSVSYGHIAGRKENGTSGNFAGYLQFGTSDSASDITERMRLDSSGNLGLGVTPSAWGSAYRAVDIQVNSALYSHAGGGQSGHASNAFFNGANWIYKTTNSAGRYEQNTIGGAHVWLTAPSGTAGNTISFTQAMTLSGTSDVSLLLGTTSSAYATSGRGLIEVNGSSSALIAIKSGDTSRGYFAAGSTATELAAVGASQPLLFTVNASERARIDSSGNLGLGVTPSAWATLKAMEFAGVGNSVSGNGTAALFLSNNAYFNSSWKYANSAAASQINLSSGAIAFNIAASGTAGNAITFTQAMTLDASGNLGIGTSSPVNKLQVAANALAAVPAAGASGHMIAFGSTPYGIAGGALTNGNGYLQVTRWDGTATNYNLLLQPNGGNVGIGTTSPAPTGGGSNSSLSCGDLAVFQAANNVSTVASNAYFDGSWKYRTTAAASSILSSQSAGYPLLVRYAASGTAGTAITWSEALRVNTSGNLGIGVTPSAWSTSGNIQIPSGAALSSNGTTHISANAYFNSPNWVYVGTNPATNYYQSAGQHVWRTAASGTAGNTISFTQAMTLTAGGELLVGGTTSQYSSGNRGVIEVNGSGNALFGLTVGGAVAGYFYHDGTNANLYNQKNGYLRFATNDTERARITAAGGFAVGTTTDPGAGNIGLAAGKYLGYSSTAYITPEDNVSGARIVTPGIIRFDAGGTTERARITAGGDFYVAKTGQSLGTVGHELRADGLALHTADGSNPLFINRLTSDGDLVTFYQDTVEEGSISVSGNTVSYNAFAGSHWSQLQDGSKPDILRGTVMESINELCVWPGENNERLPKAKISDTAGSKKVYGVFMAWDNDWTETNDMYVTAVGAFICRVNASVTVQEGDLLESNGDGTARVQADDIIRSSTIGKVTSTVKTHEYDDGSYCVPTVLYCG